MGPVTGSLITSGCGPCLRGEVKPGMLYAAILGDYNELRGP